MPSKAWATPDQEDLLYDRLDEYRSHIPDQSYGPFWESFFEEWENKYPERMSIFPDLSPDDALSGAQETELGQAIEKRQAQIVTWFRWRATNDRGGRRKKKKKKPLNPVIFGSRSRLPQLTEIYSDMYYDERIAPHISQESAANRSESLSNIKQVTRDLWDHETSDIIEHVKARYNELKQAKKDKEANPPTLPGAEEILSNLDDLPATMGRFLEYLETITGWSFTCVMGGPDPKKGGDIRVGSYHVGRTPAGKAFNQAFPMFDKVVMVPFTEYLHMVYPESTRTDNPNPSSLTTVKAELAPNVEAAQEKKKKTKDKTSAKSKGKRSDNHASDTITTSAISLPSSSASQSPKTVPGETSTLPQPPANDLLTSIVARGISGLSLTGNQGSTAAVPIAHPTPLSLSLTHNGQASPAGAQVVGNASPATSSLDTSSALSSVTSNALSTPSALNDSQGSSALSTTPSNALSTPSALNQASSAPSTAPSNALLTPLLSQASSSLSTVPNNALSTPLPSQALLSLSTVPNNALSTPIPSQASSALSTVPNNASSTPLPSQASSALSTVSSNALATPPSLNNNPIHASPPLSAVEGPLPSNGTLPTAIVGYEQLMDPFETWPEAGSFLASLYSPPKVHTADNYQLPTNFGIWPKDWEIPMPQQDNTALLSNTPFNFFTHPSVFQSPNAGPVLGPMTSATTSLPLSNAPIPSTEASSPSTNAPIQSTQALLPSPTSSNPSSASSESLTNSSNPVTLSSESSSNSSNPLSSDSSANSFNPATASSGSLAPPSNPLETSSHSDVLTPSIPNPNLTSSNDAPVPQSDSNNAIISRSGRTITPSTRNDKLNQIGNNTQDLKVVDRKENIDPGSTIPPDWMLAARQHFSTRDLGNEWNICIGTWEGFEASLNYSKSKGLPCAKDRPTEWSQWTSKSHRSYGSVPVISDPAEFGLATMVWWKKIQPPVRQASSTHLPVPISDCPQANEAGDIWVSLRKGGPNGMIIMMTLLSWWGQHLHLTTQYQEDSRELWKGCVRDVTSCLDAMIHSNVSVASRGSKRKASDDNGSNPKRVKLD